MDTKTQILTMKYTESLTFANMLLKYKHLSLNETKLNINKIEGLKLIRKTISEEFETSKYNKYTFFEITEDIKVIIERNRQERLKEQRKKIQDSHFDGYILILRDYEKFIEDCKLIYKPSKEKAIDQIIRDETRNRKYIINDDTEELFKIYKKFETLKKGLMGVNKQFNSKLLEFNKNELTTIIKDFMKSNNKRITNIDKATKQELINIIHDNNIYNDIFDLKNDKINKDNEKDKKLKDNIKKFSVGDIIYTYHKYSRGKDYYKIKSITDKNIKTVLLNNKENKKTEYYGGNSHNYTQHWTINPNLEGSKKTITYKQLEKFYIHTGDIIKCSYYCDMDR